eukprot:CAMPEP_0197515332 /NCGR_PEP_ID=MMETSP1318-20131121/500_1 /TAXON_ID=552666 /ORGANISM="Partenskyella glossopodia, Strain RCC365" /LENGTH=116 /DNA_ID=CAMNT_0043063677 /DNA_START=16 /DNA_END=366 /DNA_ORIENTATION=+
MSIRRAGLAAHRRIFQQTRRAFSKEVAKVDEAAAMPPPKPKQSTLSQRFTAFLCGVGLTGAVGYVTLRRDIYEASEGVENNIKVLHNDVLMATSKIAEVEARMSKLESKLQSLENK